MDLICLEKFAKYGDILKTVKEAWLGNPKDYLDYNKVQVIF